MVAMRHKIAINGYGRIGQALLRAIMAGPLRSQFNIVAINELADTDTLAYLTRYDTTHGRFPFQVERIGDNLVIDGEPIRILRAENPAELPWDELGVDLLMECSGSFNDRETAEQHVSAGAKRVLISHPASKDVDATIVFGINDDRLKPEHTIVSNASCTTNCIVPVLDQLNRHLGIDHGVITTIHSAMNDQPVIDSYHNTNLRLNRSSLHSIIPVDTGLSKGIERIMEEMAGKFECLHMRVPTINVSLMDLTVNVRTKTTAAEVNSILEKASESDLFGLLGYTQEPLASVDFNGDPRSGIVDGTQTRVSCSTMVKIVCWFDNEWGFANRMVDVGYKWLDSASSIG